MNTPFPGSYEQGDVQFLLKRVQVETLDVAQKERLIQSGVHYSEMLSDEKTPDERYMRLFYAALEQNGERFARDLASLARTLSRRPGKEVVLVSLARAGTPVGVLLHRSLQRLGRQSVHYCISIFRNRGADMVALDYICRRHADTDVVFIDGWTGKGVISGELARSVAEFNDTRGTALDPSLVVVADLCGSAGFAATSDDYLIPNAVLNAIVSGLISRTVLSSRYVGEGDFHACAFYEEKRHEDLSRYFVDRLTPVIAAYLADEAQSPVLTWDLATRASLKRKSDEFIAFVMDRWNVNDRNKVKPGVGESTRALLRRVPERLLVADVAAADVQHLVTMARANDVPVECDPTMPYRAAVVIKSVKDA